MLLFLTVLFLSLAYAPFKQFYLAWFALVPWLVLVQGCRTKKAAFFWSWLVGACFYFANMWWLSYVTVPGTFALLLYIAAYWGLAALIFRSCGMLPHHHPQSAPLPQLPLAACVFLIAAIWASLEFMRGYLLWGGLPWLYLAHSQTPILPMCQVADFAGQFGVSFWVGLLNAFIALVILKAAPRAALLRAGLPVGIVLVFVFAYGLFRMHQDATYDGPTVMVVQSNFPQSNSGTKGATRQDLVEYHLKITREALEQTPNVDLVVWSETMMPELNAEWRELLTRAKPSEDIAAKIAALDDVNARLHQLLRQYNVGLLTGGEYLDVERDANDEIIRDSKGNPRFDGRNSAYFFDRTGRLSTERYDKIHLVPFGEFIPFRNSVPILFKFFNLFNPYGYDYTLHPGADDAMTVFSLPRRSPGEGDRWRFITPICFEDLDSGLVASMFRPGSGGEKRADFLVNLTNDGWFLGTENILHLQAATFRSIENRTPRPAASIPASVGSSTRLADLRPITACRPASVEPKPSRSNLTDASACSRALATCSPGSALGPRRCSSRPAQAAC